MTKIATYEKNTRLNGQKIVVFPESVTNYKGSYEKCFLMYSQGVFPCQIFVVYFPKWLYFLGLIKCNFYLYLIK